MRIRHVLFLFSTLALITVAHAQDSIASEYSKPWSVPGNAIVVDPYALNPINWEELVADPRVAGFIHKATEGMPPDTACKDMSAVQYKACRFEAKYYHTGVELFKTRRQLAKKLGYKWGAYHLGRPGDPIAQARHFLQVAEPTEDEVIALDIEDINDSKWMSLEDAEKFALYIEEQTGRFPLLYSNHKVISYIAKNADRYPVLSKLSIWYARFKSDIGDVFPLGPYKTYSLWQFKSEINCKERQACPYNLAGTTLDMDLNIYPDTVYNLKAKWPAIDR